MSNSKGEFDEIVNILEKLRENKGGLHENKLPDGFAETSPCKPYYSRGGYTITKSKEYENGDVVEVNYRSRDPSSPFQIKPDVARVHVWLRRDGEVEEVYSTGWEQRV